MNPDRIIFVYNESTGLFNAVSGWTHKLISPASYACRLCRCTFGLTGMLVPWKNFVERLPTPAEFLHRDEFWLRYPHLDKVTLPVALVEKSGHIDVLLSEADIGACGGVAALIGRLQMRLDQWRQARSDPAAVQP